MSRIAVRSAVLTLGLVLFAIGSKADAKKPVAEVDWVKRPDDGLRQSLMERVTGVDVPPEDWIEPYRVGDMVISSESFSEDGLAALGLPPVPAVNYDPTPGILFLQMGGVTLTPWCGNGDSANAALDCSPLVSEETDFPSYGNAAQKAAVQQKLQGYVQDFDLVLSQNRPPEYLPYTMAVIGGSSANAGYGGGVCGIANVACDGLKRNHVSLNFTNCGNSIIADIVAQETSHNWGLEHVTNPTDLLYPTANGGFKEYVDQCMNITGNGNPACGYIHEYYCPAGEGDTQNSYGEMIGVFGPRTPDDQAPEIISYNPPDGAELTPDDSFLVTASLEENSNFIGVRWTWLEGAPDEYGNGYNRCTNKVCDDDYTAFVDPNEQPFDFVLLDGPPPGTYAFRFEAMDSRGNEAVQDITITVVEAGSEEAGETTASDESTSGAESTGAADEGPVNETGGADTTGDGTTTGADGGDGDADGGDEGCGCRGPRHGSGVLALLLVALVRRRARA